ncbi:hypothetical protein BH24PSE2_BH24PSE2_17660 [soil metagenome]
MNGELTTALEHHKAGRLGDAQRLYERILSADPEQADALHYLGLIKHQTGSGDEAIVLLRAAIRARADGPVFHCNLGVVLMEQGRLPEAAEALAAALARAPGHADTHYNLGLVRKLEHRLPEAEECFRRAIALDPRHAQAFNELAEVLRVEERLEEALQSCRRSLAISPRRIPVLLNAADIARRLDDLDTAESCYEQALVVDPEHPPALAGLAAVHRRRGRHETALSLLSRAIAADPALVVAHRQRGFVLKELGRIHDAADAFLTGAHLLRAPGAFQAQRLFTFSRTSRAKLEHDREQLEHLIRKDKIPNTCTYMIDQIDGLLGRLPGGSASGRLVNLPQETERRLQSFYNRLLYLAPAPRLSSAAVNPALDAARIEGEYAARAPGITWVDDLLTDAALTSLRNYCLESTIWFDFTHANGYLGAYMEDGFCCPLLLQIAEELPRMLPGIFGKHTLSQMWAYKYDSRLSGIDIHADTAAVNVNFWLTPSEANLLPEGGGLIVWDKEAPAAWGSKDYNSSERDDQAAIRRFLDAARARPVRVPHRQNRAVIFNSDLFHRTDEIRFREGYENRRINVTMLYGKR